MSLFKQIDHDLAILAIADTNTYRALSGINKYYYKLTETYLEPFRKFYNSVKQDQKDGQWLINTLVERAFLSGNMQVIRYMFTHDKLINIYKPHLFEVVCELNHIELVKYLMLFGNIDHSVGFIPACAYGNLEIVKLLVNYVHNVSDKLNNNDEHFDACDIKTVIRKGNHKIIKWLYNNNYYDIKKYATFLFEISTNENNVEFARYLHTNFNMELIINIFPSTTFEMMQFIQEISNEFKSNQTILQKFARTIYDDRDKVLIWLLELNNSLITVDNFKIIDDEQVAMWMFNKGVYDVNTIYIKNYVSIAKLIKPLIPSNEVVLQCITKGYHEIVKLFTVDIPFINSTIIKDFENFVINNQNMIEYLISLKRIKLPPFDELYDYALKYDKFDKLEYILNLYQKKDINCMFLIECYKNNIDVVNIMLPQTNKYIIVIGLQYAFTHLNFKLAQIIWDFLPDKPQLKYKGAFLPSKSKWIRENNVDITDKICLPIDYNYCENGKFIYLTEEYIYEWNLVDKKYKVESDEYDSPFHMACIIGSLKMIKNITNIHQIRKSLQSACYKGYINILKHMENSIATGKLRYYLEIACMHDHLEIFQWLVSLCDDTLNTLPELFKLACRNGSFSIATWLIKTHGYVNIIDMELFEHVCECSYVAIADLFQVDLLKCDNIYKDLCDNGNFVMVKWFCSKCPKYKYVIENHKIIPIIDSIMIKKVDNLKRRSIQIKNI